jgi:hypothetical protein
VIGDAPNSIAELQPSEWNRHRTLTVNLIGSEGFEVLCDPAWDRCISSLPKSGGSSS